MVVRCCFGSLFSPRGTVQSTNFALSLHLLLAMRRSGKELHDCTTQTHSAIALQSSAPHARMLQSCDVHRERETHSTTEKQNSPVHVVCRMSKLINGCCRQESLIKVRGLMRLMFLLSGCLFTPRGGRKKERVIDSRMDSRRLDYTRTNLARFASTTTLLGSHASHRKDSLSEEVMICLLQGDTVAVGRSPLLCYAVRCKS